jgi:hypothetical protein
MIPAVSAVARALVKPVIEQKNAIYAKELARNDGDDFITIATWIIINLEV